MDLAVKAVISQPGCVFPRWTLSVYVAHNRALVSDPCIELGQDGEQEFSHLGTRLRAPRRQGASLALSPLAHQDQVSPQAPLARLPLDLSAPL